MCHTLPPSARDRCEFNELGDKEIRRGAFDWPSVLTKGRAALRGGGGCRGCRVWILDVGFEPVVHFPEHMEDRFPRRVTVSLQRQQHKPDRAPAPFDSAEEA